MPHRCAFGCLEKGVVLHVFPNPDKFPERFQAWVNLVGGKLETSSDYEFYKKKRICDLHFTNEHRNRFKRLNAKAMPVLFLPGTSSARHVIPVTDNDNQLTAHSAAFEPGTSSAQHVIPVTDNDNQLTAHSAAFEPGTSSAQHVIPVTDNDNQLTAHSAAFEPGTSSAQHVIPVTDNDNQLTAHSAAFEPGTSSAQHVIPVTDNDNQLTAHSAAFEPGTSSAQHVIPVTDNDNQLTAHSAAFDPETRTSRRTQPLTQPVSNISSTLEYSIFREHNYSVKSRPNRKKLDQGSHIIEMQRKIRRLQAEVNRLRKKGLSYKQRLDKAHKMSNTEAFQTVVRRMTKPAQLLVHMQKQSRKKPKGRRYSLQEKILALSLYKKSPKCYRLLCEYFSLPSNKAMKRLLGQIKLTRGINTIIFEEIKKTMAGKDPGDRLCSLIFDEMSITPQVNYIAHEDRLEGFACNESEKFADHVIVFMVKGVKSNFKQPIAYYFTNGLNKVQLRPMIKSVIRHALKSGLIVVNTVCDQSKVNVGAIHDLIVETNGGQEGSEVIRIMGRDIIPLYDSPHLIKGFRNNLLKKDLSYEFNGEEKTVKWEYYQMIYNADKSYGELRLCDKLTEEHVTPEKIKKMRVKSATQLFSHSVAVAAEHLTARGDLPEYCRSVVDLTLLLDNLFDSLNVSSLSIPKGKKFKGPIKKNSPHHELWEKAKGVFKTIKFKRKLGQGNKIRIRKAVPSVENMIKTIQGVERLWKVLSSRYRLDALLTRNLNQDPLENFFGNIRSYGSRNIAPNSVAFEGAFKALLLNNFSSPHSKGANCEKDANECLQTLDFFFQKKNVPQVSDETMAFEFNSDVGMNPPEENDAGQSNYVCGWVLKKCLQKVVKRCKNCRDQLLDDKDKTTNENNAFIEAKEYENKKKWLCYPSLELEKYFKDVQHIAVSFLKRNVPKKNLKLTMKMFVETLIEFPFKCEKHQQDLKMHFLDIMLNVIIYSWCRSINRILSGKLTYDGNDETKMAAQVYYNKRRHYKNRK